MQPLCSSCNKLKGDRPQAWFLERGSGADHTLQVTASYAGPGGSAEGGGGSAEGGRSFFSTFPFSRCLADLQAACIDFACS